MVNINLSADKHLESRLKEELKQTSEELAKSPNDQNMQKIIFELNKQLEMHYDEQHNGAQIRSKAIWAEYGEKTQNISWV